MEDITAPTEVEIVIRDDGKVVWINVDGRCMLRASQVKSVTLDDRRDRDILRSDKFSEEEIDSMLRSRGADPSAIADRGEALVTQLRKEKK